jgi:hypothetical protein
VGLMLIGKGEVGVVCGPKLIGKREVGVVCGPNVNCEGR